MLQNRIRSWPMEVPIDAVVGVYTRSNGSAYLNRPRNSGVNAVRVRTWKRGRHSGTGGTMPYSSASRNPKRE
jgi:stringent starvation protein B